MIRETALAVDLRRVDVETTDQRDQVSDHDAFAELVDDAHGGIRAGANSDAIRILAAVAHHVKSHVAAWRFDARIVLASRRSKFAGYFGDRRAFRHHL